MRSPTAAPVIRDYAEDLPFADSSFDLDTGAWAQRYSKLLDLEECDIGYRLITTE